MSIQGSRQTIINVAVFILLEVASLCLLAAGEGARQQWIGRFFTGIQAGVWGTFDSWGEYFSLRERNERLAEENFQLRERLLAAERPEKEFFPYPREHFTLTDASIVTMTTGSQHNYLILDRGSDDDVRKDDGIISDRGIVGIILSVTPHFSYAISYANVNMTVSARVGRDGSVGSLRWSGHSTDDGILEGIPLHCRIEVGDTIYSSGFSTIFPGDIPLGTVADTKSDNGSSCEAEIVLFEDFSTLKYVTIVRNLDREEINSLSTNEKEQQ